MSMEYRNLTHVFEPVYDGNSEILILGTFPSVKSRENHFYYGHPQNRFWKVLAAVYEERPGSPWRPQAIGNPDAKEKTVSDIRVPGTIEEKKAFLLKNHIAIWDVICSCDISGSSDSSIKNVVPNRLDIILQNCQIKKIFANGATAGKLYRKYMEPGCGREICVLPSTSPANAAFSLEKLIEIWGNQILH